MSSHPSAPAERRVLMLGTFGLRPKGTMSARAAGIAVGLATYGWQARIVTVPWDNPADAGTSGRIDGIEYQNTRTVRPGRWPLAVSEIVREANRYQPDVVYLFKPKGFGDLAARYLRRMGYPVVVDMDDWEGSGGWNDQLPYSRLQRALFDWQERTWPSLACGVTAASRTLLERAFELGVDPLRVLYLPNGISRERLQQLAAPPDVPLGHYPGLDSQRRRNVLLYTRFVEFDPRFAVRIMTEVAQAIPDARLVVAGSSADGAAEQRLIRAARRAGIADRIELLGWIPSEDLGWVASRCAVALVPFDDTLINRAKCSVKVLELMACGLPIVASAVGENRDYLGTDRYGCLATPHDASSHAQLLVSLLAADPDERRAAGIRGIERASSCYRWESLSAQVADILERAAQSVSSPTESSNS